MKKKMMLSICILTAVLMMGCGKIPTMTPEQEEQIVNYAAAIALKYDAGYENRLVDLTQYPEETPGTDKEETEESEGMDEVEDTDTTDISENAGGTSSSSIEEFYGVSGVRIDYTGASYCDSYPEGSVEDYYFTLDATEGKRLLVLQFQVNNTTDAAVDVDFFSVAPRFRISVNGNSSKNILSTMLMDDLRTYIGTLQPGETVPLVLLAEIEEQDAGEIESLTLTMINESESVKISLQ